MVVRDCMTTDLVTVELGETVQEAVEAMLQFRVGSVLVKNGDEVVGIITETDVLAAGAGFERPYVDIPVSRTMSKNIITIEPDAPLSKAMAKMHDYTIKKLPVLEDEELVGIITMTDLIYHEHELVEEAKRLEERREAENG